MPTRKLRSGSAERRPTAVALLDRSIAAGRFRSGAGLGPRVPHHRFSDAPGLESAFFRGSPPLSGAVDDLTLRSMRRAVALAFALAMCVVRYWLARLLGPMTLERRALWLQGAARAILKVLDIKTQVEGQPPMCGLVVSNHLSYLDIIIISATMPCFFVAKMEIDGWPFFGKAARSGGTMSGRSEEDTSELQPL